MVLWLVIADGLFTRGADNDTLLHEVGHHFGMDAQTLREIEGES